jgi:hypothetical protein
MTASGHIKYEQQKQVKDKNSFFEKDVEMISTEGAYLFLIKLKPH